MRGAVRAPPHAARAGARPSRDAQGLATGLTTARRYNPGIADAIFTIGHSTHELPRLISLLKGHRVGAVADVRLHPGSRRLPQFNREELERVLPDEGIQYLHLPQLGGRRRPLPDSPNAGWNVAGFRGYADHMASAEFATGLQRLQELARELPTALMCAEGLWWRCHRRLIADALTVRGWRVRHIAPDGSTADHELTAFALPDDERLTYPPAQPTLPSE